MSQLNTIDLHPDPYSADPPYTALAVFGTPLSEKIKVELSGYGFDNFDVSPLGFTAVRSLPRE
jgi:hypothetical protein